MEYNEMAAKRRKKRKSSFIYAPFVHFRGNSLLPVCSLCKRLQDLNLRKTTICLGNTDSDAPISAPISPACPDLWKVIEAWPELSEPLRRAILAIANSATDKGGQ